MKKYIDIIQRLQQICLLLIFFLLPFPNTILRYCILAWAVLWLLEGRWLRRPLPIHANQLLIPVLCFSGWYLIKIISGLWVADTFAWLDYLESHATFAAMILVAIWGLHERYNWRHLLFALIGGCISVSIIYPCILFWQYHALPAEAQLPSIMDLTWYMENISHLKHRLFLCLVELIAIISMWLLRTDWIERMGKIRAYVFLGTTTLLMLFTILSTGARLPLLLIPVLLVILLFSLLTRQQMIRWGLGTILGFTLLGGIIYHFHPRKDEIKWQDIVNFRQQDISHHDARLNIWAFCIETPQDYLAYGLGAGQTSNYIRNKYEQADWQWYLDLGFNKCHCQYLTELMENGIAGLLFFILCWIILLYYARGDTRLPAIIFCTIFAMSMLTDDVLDVFNGISLWGTGMLLLLLLSRSQSPTTES